MTDSENGPKGLTRRNFVKAAGAGAAALGALPVVALAAEDPPFDAEFDVVVCGSGGAGLTTALFSRWRGNSVVVLEKAGSIGGTTAKAAFWYWVPNNEAMRKKGMLDPRPDFLKFVARLSAPQTFSPDLPKYGLDDWTYSMCEAIYDSASTAAQMLADKGALPYTHLDFASDYWAELPENKAPKGRVLFPEGGSAGFSDGGRVAIGKLSSAARREGVGIQTSREVKRVIIGKGGEVIGVEALNSISGTTIRLRAKKGVVFATGGFTHNKELRSNFLMGPVYGGCAAPTNEGDIIGITSTLGVQLRNMNHAWMCPVVLDKVIAKDPSMSGVFATPGDSTLMVNKYGKRVTNEKMIYNEQAQTFFHWDGLKAEYTNLVMIQLWDQRAQDTCASGELGSVIAPADGDVRHVLKGDTLEKLTQKIGEHMEKFKAYTNATLDVDFLPNLKKTLSRFNSMAKSGKDEDFHRGDRPAELMFTGAVHKEPGQKNFTMWPLSSKGPYYAALLTAGTLDTKGGPKTDPDGRILDVANRPIAGLYGVGNCVASATNNSYWSGGGTLGPILAFAYRAAEAIHRESSKS